MTPPASPQVAHVLVVEDDPGAAHALADILDSSGYQVSLAGSGAEARSMVEQRPPDLLVLDLTLPDVDGLVLLSLLKAAYDLPVLVCSARDLVRERVLALKLGADDYVVKPFDIYELEARVEAVIRRAQRSHVSAA